MKSAVTLLLLVLTAGAVNAQSLANRAAQVFEQACLSNHVLALDSGVDVGLGAVAALHAGNVFAHFEKAGKAEGLRGTPDYTLPANGDYGIFSCFVVSKDLSARDATNKFNRLKNIAGGGQKPTYVGPAKFDDDPERYIEGKRAEFESDGRKLLLELFHFMSDKGPVGGLYLKLEHKVSR
ncbi:hypothetical protein [Cognatishimia maritima]|uniref:Uncharacterized protein n=1 Tax=Cognatishimia maritima TaxID=870908 RepID=A0A1M5RV08_9RHOB|nr:hypothetical protein [Cognatishimia maritima]SHH30147.1 hypothetical protein SAMN04488044_2308 [Cognatishimia maritima]